LIGPPRAYVKALATVKITTLLLAMLME